jgi:UDP-N-acetylglucosamine 3-dehydrogenase
MSNVGVVIDLAVHDIDLIRWFTESDIVEVQPQLSSAIAERGDIALLQFRTASGVLAHINTNWLTPFKARNDTVATRRKYVMGDLLTRQVTECFGFKPDGSYSMHDDTRSLRSGAHSCYARPDATAGRCFGLCAQHGPAGQDR